MAAYHNVFSVHYSLTELHEIVEGEVIEITNLVLFRIGPIDGLVHVSQVTDDYINYDAKRALIVKNQNFLRRRISPSRS